MSAAEHRSRAEDYILISARYAELNTFLPQFIKYLTTHMARFAVSQATIDALTDEQARWDENWALYKSPSTQTKIARARMSTSYKAVDRQIRQIQQTLKHNGEIALNPTDYSELDIHIDKTTRTRAKPPTVAPTNRLLDTKTLTNKISTYPYGVENPPRRLPEYAKKITREVAVTDTTEPPPRSAYRAIDAVGRNVYLLRWRDEDKYKHGWLITKYQNSRGETGPPSEPLMMEIE